MVHFLLACPVYTRHRTAAGGYTLLFSTHYCVKSYRCLTITPCEKLQPRTSETVLWRYVVSDASCERVACITRRRGTDRRLVTERHVPVTGMCLWHWLNAMTRHQRLYGCASMALSDNLHRHARPFTRTRRHIQTSTNSAISTLGFRLSLSIKPQQPSSNVRHASSS